MWAKMRNLVIKEQLTSYSLASKSRYLLCISLSQYQLKKKVIIFYTTLLYLNRLRGCHVYHYRWLLKWPIVGACYQRRSQFSIVNTVSYITFIAWSDFFALALPQLLPKILFTGPKVFFDEVLIPWGMGSMDIHPYKPVNIWLYKVEECTLCKRWKVQRVRWSCE